MTEAALTPLLSAVAPGEGLPPGVHTLLHALLGAWHAVTDWGTALRVLRQLEAGAGAGTGQGQGGRPRQRGVNLVTLKGEIFKADGEIVFLAASLDAAASGAAAAGEGGGKQGQGRGRGQDQGQGQGRGTGGVGQVAEGSAYNLGPHVQVIPDPEGGVQGGGGGADQGRNDGSQGPQSRSKRHRAASSAGQPRPSSPAPPDAHRDLDSRVKEAAARLAQQQALCTRLEREAGQQEAAQRSRARAVAELRSRVEGAEVAAGVSAGRLQAWQAQEEQERRGPWGTAAGQGERERRGRKTANQVRLVAQSGRGVVWCGGVGWGAG